MGRPRIPRIKKECPQCLKKFEAINSEVKRGNGIYCGNVCKATYAQRNVGHNVKSLTMKHRGYILSWAPKHPRQVKGYVPQHRLVMESHIGRLLTNQEQAHHINEIKNDNRVSNMQVVSAAEHMKIHNGRIVVLDGDKMIYNDALKKLGVTRSSVNRYRKKYGKTQQEGVDHYAKGTAKFRRRHP